MRCTRVVAAVGLGVLVACLIPATSSAQGRVREGLRALSYFPLEVGTYWTYERQGPSGTSTWRAEVVADPAATAERGRHRLAGYFPGPARLVRVLPLDIVTEVRPEGGRDGLLYMLRAPAGLPWTLELAGTAEPGSGAECIDGSRLHVAAWQEKVTVPAGQFENVVKVVFSTRCADAGVSAEWFAPGIGLIRRTEASIAGEVVSELVETNAGGGWPLRMPYTTSLALDRAVAVNDLMPPVDIQKLPVLKGTLSVRNDTETAVELTFGGCVRALVELVDRDGEVVLQTRADDGRDCNSKCLVPVQLRRSTLALPFRLPLVLEGGRPLADGVYAVRARFETLEPEPVQPAATARLEVRSTH